jgi:hypothetical protein
MMINKERLHELIDKIPKKYYEEVEQELKKRIIPVSEPTVHERKSIEEGKKQIDRGDFHTIDEFLKEIEDKEK